MRRQERRRQDRRAAKPDGPPAFPIETLPYPLRVMVEATARAYQVDLAFTAMAALWAVDLAMRGKLYLPGMATDEETDDLFEPLIQGAIARGHFTQAALDAVMEPLRRGKGLS